MTMQHETTSSFGGRYGWKRKAAALGAVWGALALGGAVQAQDESWNSQNWDWDSTCSTESIDNYSTRCHALIVNGEWPYFYLYYERVDNPVGKNYVSLHYYCSISDVNKQIDCKLGGDNEYLTGNNGANFTVGTSGLCAVCNAGFDALDIAVPAP